MDAMAAIKQTFFQECEEQLAELESGLLAMEEGVSDAETVNAVFRAVHSIKGGAGAFQLSELVQFAHLFETSLDQVRSGQLPVTPDLMKTMLRAADVLADLVRGTRDGIPLPQQSWEASADELRRLSTSASDANDAGSSAESEESGGIDFQPITVFVPNADEDEVSTKEDRNEFLIRFRPKSDLYTKANDPILILRNLEQLGDLSVECDVSAIPTLDALDPIGGYLDWSIRLITDRDEAAIRGEFEFVEEDCDLGLTSPASIEPSSEDIAALIKNAIGDVASLTASEAGRTATPVVAEVALEQETSGAPDHSARKQNADGAAKTRTESSTPPPTIRVDLDRVDRLINLVGELVINRAMLSQRVSEAGAVSSSAVSTGLAELEQLTREIQDSVMAIRAQPVKPLFQRMTRIVREVADATGKSVRLKTEGEATEVDKTVIERLADPLTHMIRNAVDHGLEMPEARIAAGKSEEGIVKLTASHRSGRIVIEVADDGGGINRRRVLESAIHKGLVPEGAQLSDSEIDNLLFLPGFSTASSVSNISGRGVGMDVVKRSIQALGGRISITSVPGSGTTFSMSLPLTLAVLDGMVVSVCEQTFVVPITAIVETLQPKAIDVHGLGSGARVVSIRDSFIPLIDVASELGYAESLRSATAGVAILVESEAGARHALLVDRIVDQRQVVIKSLEANYGPIDGVAAATILGDGRVALILDVDAIVKRSRKCEAAAEPPLAVAS